MCADGVWRTVGHDGERQADSEGDLKVSAIHTAAREHWKETFDTVMAMLRSLFHRQ